MQPMIFFDVDGVVVRGYSADPHLCRWWDEHITRDLGIDRQAFKEKFINGPFQGEVILGKKSLYDALRDVQAEIGGPPDPQQVIDYWLQHDAVINQDLMALVQAWKKNGSVRMFLATNQEHCRARYLMEDMGLKDYFEDIFYSARIGAMKPDKLFFEWIAKKLSLKPFGSCRPILIDDTPRNVAAACAYGWDAVQFREVGDLYHHHLITKTLDGATL